MEWSKKSLVEGLPEAQIAGNPIVEVVKDCLAVGALWGCCEPNEDSRFQLIKQPNVGRSLRVMEFVYDDDIPSKWIKFVNVTCERLDRGEHVVALTGRSSPMNRSPKEASFSTSWNTCWLCLRISSR